MPKQEPLNLPLAGTVADVRDKLAAAEQSHKNAILIRCFCCGERYVRGAWKCCAPPNGQKWAAWSRQWHEDCPTAEMAEGAGKRKCPRHCRCERQLDGKGNLPLPRAAGITPTNVKDLVEVLRRPNPARTSSLPVDEAFLKSEWPEENR